MSITHPKISAVARAFPAGVLTNEQLSEEFPDWSVEKISEKTGIRNRHVASEDEFTSDLAISAGQKLFAENDIDPETIDFLIVVTQSPDYFLPTTACIVHEVLQLREDCGTYDINMGCSGFIYALGVAAAYISAGSAKNVLVITSDTYTKFINPLDRSVRTIFGDGATATLVNGEGSSESIGAFVYGTDGKGAKNLIVPNGGLRAGEVISPRSEVSTRGFESNGFDLFMDGAEIFNFTLRIAKPSLDKVLESNGMNFDDVDYFVFHQANAFMLNHLKAKLEIEDKKFPIVMGNWGNTVSSTIPMALCEMGIENLRGKTLVLMGFGVGLSWAAVTIKL